MARRSSAAATRFLPIVMTLLACGGPRSAPSEIARPVATASVTAPKPPPGPPAPIAVVSADERSAERARWNLFGLTVPEDGPVLPDPFAEPLSRRSFVVPTAWFDVDPQKGKPASLVGAADVRADLVILERAMRVVYGGWDSATARGWSWDVWFEAWSTALERRGDAEITIEEAFGPPMRELMAFQLDNHTTVPLGLRLGSASRSASLAQHPTADCDLARFATGDERALDARDPAQQPRRAFRADEAVTRLEAVSYIAYPATRGDLRAVRCGQVWIDATPAFAGPTPTMALAQTTSDEPSARRLSDAISLIRLPTFSKQNAERLAKAKPGWPVPTGRERVLVVDLRDNDGGDAAFSALDPWVPWKEIEPRRGFRRRLAASPAYHGFRWGYTAFSSRKLEPPLGDQMRKSLQYAMDQLYVDDGRGAGRRFDETDGGARYRAQTFDPDAKVTTVRLMIVVNERCGSDCEYMAAILRGLPGAVVVGTNTFGVAQFIQPGYSVLPHTRLPFRVALGTSDMYGDGRSFDGYGLDVDILLPTAASHEPDRIVRLAQLLSRRVVR